MPRIAFFILLFAFLSSACLPCLASQQQLAEIQQLEREVQALKPADIPALRAQAEAGNRRSQYMLARAYESGYGVGEDYGEAFKWLKKAASSGARDVMGAYAYHHLGIAYWLGRGVPKDEAKAFECYALAALDGRLAVSAWVAGGFYVFGEGGRVIDLSQAAKFYRIAYEEGQELIKSKARARLDLFDPPCANSSAGAQGSMGIYFCEGLRVVLASRQDDNGLAAVRQYLASHKGYDLVLEHCTVTDSGNYECELGEDQRPEAFEKLVAAVEASLPAGWQGRLRTSGDIGTYSAGPGPGSRVIQVLYGFGDLHLVVFSH